MSQDLKKKFEELLDLAQQHGVRVVRDKKHTVVYPKDKNQRPLVFSKTPSDYRSVENLKAQLRRAGVPIPHKGGTPRKKKEGKS